MKSPNSSSNIELDDLTSISERNARSTAPNSKPTHSYLPQEDEDSPLESNQPLSISAKLSKNKCVNLLILFILCIALIDLPILGVGVFQYVKQVTFKNDLQGSSLLKSLRFMSENLKTDPIMDIVLGAAGPCPVGFQILKLGIWPATPSACLCENGDLYRTSCTEVNSPQCTKELPSSFRTNLYEWFDWFWCAKRAVEGTDYVKKAKCPQDYQECYPGGCFRGKCPVTRIPSSSSITHVEGSPYGTLKLEKAQGKLPLVNVQWTLGETLCDIQETESYKSMADKENECDKYGLYQQVSTRMEAQIAYSAYIDNLFPYSFMRLQSFVGNEAAASSVLSSVSRMKTTNIDHCQDIDEKAINEFLEAIPNKANLACIVLVFLLQLKVIVNVIRALTLDSPTKLVKNSSRLRKTLCILNVIAFVVVILMLVNFTDVYVSWKAAREYFEEYSSLECFVGGAGESAGEKVINDFLKILKEENAGSWVYLALLVSKILAGLLCCRIYFVGGKQSYKEPKGPKKKNLKPVSLRNVLSGFE